MLSEGLRQGVAWLLERRAADGSVALNAGDVLVLLASLECGAQLAEAMEARVLAPGLRDLSAPGMENVVAFAPRG